jgi:hypothetical protein
VTTLACNLKEMAGDTRVSWEEVGMDTVQAVKIFVGKDAIYGMTGGNCTGVIRALEWLQSEQLEDRKPQPPEYEHDWDWRIFELSEGGIAVYNEFLEREQTIEPMLALGSGRKVALYCMRYLKMSPAEAVREACKVDHHSELPVYRASLAGMEVELWKPPKKIRKAVREVVPV